MIDDDLVDRAIDIFGPMAGREIGRDEAREMVRNLTTFFRILAEVQDSTPESRVAERPISSDQSNSARRGGK